MARSFWDGEVKLAKSTLVFAIARRAVRALSPFFAGRPGAEFTFSLGHMHAVRAPPRPLLVFVPFTSADVPALARGHELWQQTLPCAADGLTAPSLRPGLMYLFNGHCGANVSDSCAQVMRIVRGTAATSCFRSVLVRGAHLSGKEDRYDKQRRSAAWTAGPNNLFHRAAAKARRLGYWYMMQLEPDVLPLRPGWLDHVVYLTHLSDAWVMGSALLANCTREETVVGCT